MWCSFFLRKCNLVLEKWLFSFDRSNMQIFTVNITRVVWPHVTNLLDLRYFCQHNPLFYHLNLIPCHCWSWQRNIYFLVNTFVRHTFPMLKSSITESSELLAFKRQKDGYKVTVNVYLCICVVPSWDELKVRQNLLASDNEIYMVCLLAYTNFISILLSFKSLKLSRFCFFLITRLHVTFTIIIFFLFLLLF